MQRHSSWFAVLVLAAVTGCATPPNEPKSPPPSAPAAQSVRPAPTPPPAPAPLPSVDPQKVAAQTQLDEGIALYDSGDFNGAVRRLTTGTDLSAGPVPLQVQGLKYLAFSYCVTNRVTLCQQQFEKALKLDPTFDLSATERTHPIWGPAFVRAKNPKPATPAAGSTTAPAKPAAPASPGTPAKPAGS